LLSSQLQQLIGNLPRFLPEAWTALSFLMILGLELLFKNSRYRGHCEAILRYFSLGFVAIAMLLALQQWQVEAGFLFQKMLFLDDKAIFFKLLTATATLLVLLHIGITQPKLPTETYALLLASLLGLFLMSMSVNLLSIYLSIELVSIGSYLLTAIPDGRKSSEGGLKYVLFGALSSALMLYGMSLLYGLTGTLEITNELLAGNLSNNADWVVFVAAFLVLAGVLFKQTLVPLHLWAPDVYESAPTPIVAFFSTAPKIAALLVFMRLISVFPAALQFFTTVVALASILLGNLSALWQSDFKRLMAYSGIAQAGFMVVGLAAFNQTGFEAATFYAAVYCCMNVAAFLLFDLLAQGKTDIQSLAGLGTQKPFLSALFTLVMLSLVGIPPTAGFSAKLFVFSSLWEAYQTNAQPYFLWLFGIGLLNAVISLFYYLKVVFFLFFRPPSKATPENQTSLLGIFVAFTITIPLILWFFRPDWLMNLVRQL
jgi:NADH-quinone oxidoreductase subunit N